MPAPKDPAAYELWIERLRVSHRGKKHTLEQRAKIGASVSIAKRGIPRPDMQGDGNPMRRPDVAAKVGAAHRGKVISSEQRAETAKTLRGRYVGAKNGNWQEEAGYIAVHSRARRALPNVCTHCGTTEGRLDCALRHDAPAESIRVDPRETRFSVAWPPDLAYIRLCKRCHMQYDGNRPPSRRRL